MNVRVGCSVVLVAATSLIAEGTQKPRVFITESGAAQATGNAALGNAKGSLAFMGGASPESVEVIKTFSRHCSSVIITADLARADYIVRLDHEGVNPTTPFVHGNKVAVFNRERDLLYSNSTHTLAAAVKDACSALSAEDKLTISKH